MDDDVFVMPKRPDRFWRLAEHIAQKPGQTRDQLRGDYLNRYVPLTQNEMIQGAINCGLVDSVPVAGQRAHKLYPSIGLRRVRFANDNNYTVAADGSKFVGPDAEQAEVLFKIAA